LARLFEIHGYAAIPAILAVAGAAFVMKPTELHRDPLIEIQGLVGLAPKYEVIYAHCAGATDAATLDDAGLVKGFTGGYTHHFPARSDADAARFAMAARPQCNVASLYRLDRRFGSKSRYSRYARTRIDI